MICELAIISGKGGTGKTSVAASFAALAEKKILVNCDVDAADLHLILNPHVIHREDFVGGKKARIISEQCIGCGKCVEVCRFDAISLSGPANDVIAKTYRIDEFACEGCGLCSHFCPNEAVDFSARVSGEWYVSETRHGPLVHARLGVAKENSGKLVATVRRKAREIAEEQELGLIIIDGSPGIGCPVISSITGTTMVLVVTEPSFSGLHDLDRVADLTHHFGIPTAVCVNKSDINPEITSDIRSHCQERGLDMLGEIRYDTKVTRAQIEGKSTVEYSGSIAAQDIRTLWNVVVRRLQATADDKKG
jgi:MinD superfamily P-loop ATPase